MAHICPGDCRFHAADNTRRLSLSFSPPGATLLAADTEKRTLRGTVLPYGIAGHTSAGTVQVLAGAVSLPDADRLDRVKLNRDHDANRPIGYATAAEDTETALVMSFHIGATPDGDAALLDAAERLRDALSVELIDVAFSDEPDDSGVWAVTAGTLVGVAQCSTPAFADARITDVAAGHTPQPQEGHDIMTTTPAADATASVPETTPAIAAGTAAAPADLRPATGTRRPRVSATRHLAELLCSLKQGRMVGAELSAALSDVIYSETEDLRAPAYAGELWDGASYTRKIWPLMNHADLTTMKGTGWRFTTTPEVESYAGDKAEIPSGPVATAPVSWTAERVAGGHDIDRAYFDFGDTEFIAAYWREMTDSWLRVSDAKYLAALISWAGASVGSAAGFFEAASKAMAAVEDSTDTSPSFVLVNPADVRALIGQTTLEKSAWLDELGLDVGSFVRHTGIASGTVIAGVKQAGVFREAGVPIRVQAVDVAHGGIDAALFGYLAFNQVRPGGIAKATFTP